ncbi:MAG: hypothetical protein ABL999_15790 [Pyrinomonadaceae bacterium]
MKVPANTIVKTPAFLTQKLFKLERCGRYSDALEELNAIWPDQQALPDLDGFEPEEAAELLMRCGSLIGFHGHNVQEKGAQETSRDLLMSAQGHFLSWENFEKASECENYLALSYWRTGEMNEAQIWLDEALSRNLPATDPRRLYSQIVQCLINIPAKKDAENLESLKSLEPAFLQSKDDCLKGDYFNHCGIALDNLGRKAEALQHFEFARFHHRRSGHKIYLGTIENNLAWLYKDAGELHKAHEAIDTATETFHRIKDKTREGFSLDTKAALLLSEGRYVEALTTVEKALSLLKQSDNSAYQVETLLTKAKVLVHLDNFPDAVVSLIDAVNITRVQTGEESAKRLIVEFEKTLNLLPAAKSVTQIKEPDIQTKTPQNDGFELILPESVGHYSDFRGIWINNDRLANAGLVKGSLAIVAKTAVKRGDLAAINEIASGQATCGFYDAEFGIVCLEGSHGDPQVFDEAEVQILGKIVGVCREGNIRKGGKVKVEAILP